MEEKNYEGIFREGKDYGLKLQRLEERLHNFRINVSNLISGKHSSEYKAALANYRVTLRRVFHEIERDYIQLHHTLEDKPLEQTKRELGEIGEEIKKEREIVVIKYLED